jgi:FtsH-binding integral membrane protein
METTTTTKDTVEFDAGLRSFMIGVYRQMGLGILLTGILAWVAANEPVRHFLFYRDQTVHHSIHYTILGWIVAFAPLATLGFLGITGKSSSNRGSSFAFWITAVMFGLISGVNFMRYSGLAVADAFFLAAFAFGGLSLFGYTTKINLNAVGAFCMMGLFGLIAVILLSVFMHIPGLTIGICLVGLLIFAGFTAYDTQKLKDYYHDAEDGEAMATIRNLAALNLYLDFINIFQFLLILMGNSNSDD